MQPAELTYFTVTLFCALFALIKWKRRRDEIATRMNRGLRGYVAAKDTILVPVREQRAEEEIIAI